MNLTVYGAAAAAALMVNIWTILRFWQDKRFAVSGQRRIPESDLLWLATIGGSPAAYFARWLFRHKTRKQPFSTHLHLIAVVQVGVLIGMFAPT
jgi:uncharacterized membrane protein YsdA (DUF1294 family)